MQIHCDPDQIEKIIRHNEVANCPCCTLMHLMVKRLRRDLGAARSAERAAEAVGVTDIENVVEMRPGCKPVVWKWLNGKRTTNRKLPFRDDLVCANHQRLALAVLAWFTTENEALDAYEAFHIAHCILQADEVTFTITGEQVQDWLIEWRARS